jgi:hypothetical protein
MSAQLLFILAFIFAITACENIDEADSIPKAQDIESKSLERARIKNPSRDLFSKTSTIDPTKSFSAVPIVILEQNERGRKPNLTIWAKDITLAKLREILDQKNVDAYESISIESYRFIMDDKIQLNTKKLSLVTVFLEAKPGALIDLGPSIKKFEQRAQEGHDGANGLDSGDLYLAIEHFELLDNGRPLFKLHGGDGQDAGLGRNGRDAITPDLRLKSKKSGDIILQCNHSRPRPNDHCGILGSNCHIKRRESLCQPMVDGCRMRGEGINCRPLDGENAVRAGRPGAPGRGGSVRMNKAHWQLLIDSKPGRPGAMGDDTQGGAPSWPSVLRAQVGQDILTFEAYAGKNATAPMFRENLLNYEGQIITNAQIMRTLPMRLHNEIESLIQQMQMTNLHEQDLLNFDEMREIMNTMKQDQTPKGQELIQWIERLNRANLESEMAKEYITKLHQFILIEQARIGEENQGQKSYRLSVKELKTLSRGEPLYLDLRKLQGPECLNVKISYAEAYGEADLAYLELAQARGHEVNVYPLFERQGPNRLWNRPVLKGCKSTHGELILRLKNPTYRRQFIEFVELSY